MAVYRIHLSVFIGRPEMLSMEFVTAKDVKLRLQRPLKQTAIQYVTVTLSSIIQSPTRLFKQRQYIEISAAMV